MKDWPRSSVSDWRSQQRRRGSGGLPKLRIQFAGRDADEIVVVQFQKAQLSQSLTFVASAQHSHSTQTISGVSAETPHGVSLLRDRFDGKARYWPARQQLK